MIKNKKKLAVIVAGLLFVSLAQFYTPAFLNKITGSLNVFITRQQIPTVPESVLKAKSDYKIKPYNLVSGKDYTAGRIILKLKKDVLGKIKNNKTPVPIGGAYPKESVIKSLIPADVKKIKNMYSEDKCESCLPETGFGNHKAEHLSVSTLSSEPVKIKNDIAANLGLDRIFIVEVPPESDVLSLIKELKKNPRVAYAEPDYTVRASQEAPNDPYFSYLWGIPATNTDDVWPHSEGVGVVVAVIDTGVDQNHEDLEGKVLETGWDYVEGDDDPNDANGHGTHVAGTIAAIKNNNKGIAGVAPSAKIMDLRVLNAEGSGSITDFESAIYFAVNNGADIINASLATEVPSADVSQSLHDAIIYANSMGVVFVAAAGNSADLASRYYPAAYEEAITVSAVDVYLNRYVNTNYGEAVDIAAPGVNIASTRLGAYFYMTGTSMATPHVSGIVALLLSEKPYLPPEAVKNILANTVQSLNDKQIGAGIIDARAAFDYIKSVSLLEKLDLNANNTLELREAFRGVRFSLNSLNNQNSEYDLDNNGITDHSDILWFSSGVKELLSGL